MTIFWSQSLCPVRLAYPSSPRLLSNLFVSFLTRFYSCLSYSLPLKTVRCKDKRRQMWNSPGTMTDLDAPNTRASCPCTRWHVTCMRHRVLQSGKCWHKFKWGDVINRFPDLCSLYIWKKLPSRIRSDSASVLWTSVSVCVCVCVCVCVHTGKEKFLESLCSSNH